MNDLESKTKEQLIEYINELEKSKNYWIETYQKLETRYESFKNAIRSVIMIID